MWQILISIGMALVKFASSPIVAAILAKVLEDLLQTGKEAVPYVEKAVEEAMRHGEGSADPWTYTQRADYVRDQLLAQFPKISGSLLNRLMENVYGVLQPPKPTVPLV